MTEQGEKLPPAPGFKLLEWQTDAKGCVEFPRPFGDAELISVEMAHASLTLVLTNIGYFDRQGKYKKGDVTYRVVCKDASFLSMETDHLQNVVEELWIIQDRKAAMAFKTYAGRNLFPSTFSSEAKFYVFLTPISGIELFAACSDVVIWSNF